MNIPVSISTCKNDKKTFPKQVISVTIVAVVWELIIHIEIK